MLYVVVVIALFVGILVFASVLGGISITKSYFAIKCYFICCVYDKYSLAQIEITPFLYCK